MAEQEKYFQVKRSFFRAVGVGKLSKDGLYLIAFMMDSVQYDTRTCTFSFQDAAKVLGCGRKKATKMMEKLRTDRHISYLSGQGKHRFEVTINAYFAPNSYKKEQVEIKKEHVGEQVRSSTDKHDNDLEKDKLGNKSKGPNIIQNNKIEDNEIKDNEPLSFFNSLVPEGFVKQFGYKNVIRKMSLLGLDYKEHPPNNPLGLLRDSLEKNYAPSDTYLIKEKNELFGVTNTVRSGDGLTNPFATGVPNPNLLTGQ